MGKQDNGGSAFPVHEIRTDDGTGIMAGERGMSLRDWFAGQALANMRVHENSDNPLYWQSIANAAFVCADAMLEARKHG